MAAACYYALGQASGLNEKEAKCEGKGNPLQDRRREDQRRFEPQNRQLEERRLKRQELEELAEEEELREKQVRREQRLQRRKQEGFPIWGFLHHGSLFFSAQQWKLENNLFFLNKFHTRVFDKQTHRK